MEYLTLLTMSWYRVSETPKMKLLLTTTGSWKQCFKGAKHTELRSTTTSCSCALEKCHLWVMSSAKKALIKIDYDKARAVLEIPRPEDVEEVYRLKCL